MTESPKIIRHIEGGQICCDPEWEAAYKRFETPEEEVNKFRRRLERFSFPDFPRDIQIAEIFCGRGGGLVALERMGFECVEGVDLSESLLQEYRGDATLHLADCLQLPLDEASYDAVIVQGGLHHLENLSVNLPKVFEGVRRILKPGGQFFVIEPWQTPFLQFVHLVVEQPVMRRIYARGDALAAMTDCERVTYEQWLGMPDDILAIFDESFETVSLERRWGKLAYVGTPRC